MQYGQTTVEKIGISNGIVQAKLYFRLTNLKTVHPTTYINEEVH